MPLKASYSCIDPRKSALHTQKMSIAQMIKTARKRRKITQKQLADAVGVERAAVGQWESGKTKPSTGHLLKVLEFLRISGTWEEIGAIKRISDVVFGETMSLIKTGRPTPQSLPIMGEVAAGHWFEIDSVDEPKYYELVIAPFDPRYPKESQYGLIVRGTSINRIAQPGEILQCIDIGISGLEPREDDLVIVERRRSQAGQKEVTAKRYRKQGHLIELSPESDDKRWTKPLVLNQKTAPEGEEIAIIAIVVGVYKTLRK